MAVFVKGCLTRKTIVDLSQRMLLSSDEIQLFGVPQKVTLFYQNMGSETRPSTVLGQNNSYHSGRNRDPKRTMKLAPRATEPE